MTPRVGQGADREAEPRDTLGRALRDLRISVTDRCNFRCPYCMPEEIFGEGFPFKQRAEILRFEEITRLARLFAQLGTRKLRLTGGEPLLRAQLPKLVAELAAIDGIEDVALTTNAVLLPRHAEALRDAGLHRVTVSLDAVDREPFLAMSGGKSEPEAVFDGIAAAERAGLTPIKINAVVRRGVNEDQVVELARRFRGTGHIVRYIEYMDVGTTNSWDLSEVVPAAEILERIGSEFPIEPVDANYPGEVARRYRYTDGSGEVGIIASVTQPFCGGCTRARISADGRLFTCLFAGDGRDLREPLREGASDEALLERISGTWRRRDDRYSEERTERAPARARRKVEMFQIGG